jgi:hypothetical protein
MWAAIMAIEELMGDMCRWLIFAIVCGKLNNTNFNGRAVQLLMKGERP